MYDPDLTEYLSEYKLQEHNEPISHYKDGELEAEWLTSAGFPQLTKAFKEGRELSANILSSSVAGLPKVHAEAIKLRVLALNRTVRGRTRLRNSRKPDIRDVFKDLESLSTGTRSRSATPDSLDSLPSNEPWAIQPIPNFVTIFDNTHITPGQSKQNLKRTPSAPLRGSADLFRGSHIRCDIPFYTAEGIELLNFQRLGTVHIPRVRSGSDPSCSVGRRSGAILTSARSHSNLYDQNKENISQSKTENSSDVLSNAQPAVSLTSAELPLSHNIQLPYELRANPEPISFENICRENYNSEDGPDGAWMAEGTENKCDIALLSDVEVKRVQPLLWLELASIFDRHNIILDKRKPFKRIRKEEGNVFGVSLNALVRRDQQVTGEDSSLVPLLLQGIVNEIEKRGIKEEGILRVPGNKQKVEILYNDLEQNFYARYGKDNYLKKAGVHDLSTLLKRWMRELPNPLLANDLVHLFYQTHAVPFPDQFKALSILALLLPPENRNTLRALSTFLQNVIAMEPLNKMSKHNVATIIAPSLFPPRFVHPTNKNDIAAQVRMAAQCCMLTNIIISKTTQLWMVPQHLIDQATQMNSMEGSRTVYANGVIGGVGKRVVTRKTKSALNTKAVKQFDANHIHKIIIS